MGSLPNLHELGKNGESYRPTPALGNLCGNPQPTCLSQEEKSKILHRYSGHGRLMKTRSNGNENKIIVGDEFLLEHNIPTYSPTSIRTLSTHPPRPRRDSINSSIGATSVRRLIAVVRPSHSRHPPSGPAPSRSRTLSNLISLSSSHLLSTSALLPFLTLQSSVTAFSPPYINLGSLLVATLTFAAASSAPFGPALVRQAGSNVVIATCYFIYSLFYLSHLIGSFWLLVPAYILTGACLGAGYAAGTAFLMVLAQRVCWGEGVGGRGCVIRRMARVYQAAHDVGLMVGSVISALVVAYTVSLTNEEWWGKVNVTNGTLDTNSTNTSFDPYDYSAFLDDIFDTYEGSRLCGAAACPRVNSSAGPGFTVVPTATASALSSTYAVMTMGAAVVAAAGLDKVRAYVLQDPLERPGAVAALRAVRDTFWDGKLRLAAPMAFFVGVEQAFIYSDFSKSYVVCTLGVHRLNLVFLAMGLLQSIAACTLSMFLRSIRRYYVVAVGFTFHACLLMVLMLWKPTEDDPALFYVISASWGVCNAIWEMLIFTLLTGLYQENWESAFANSTIFRYIGMTLTFIFHSLLCNYLKLYALGFFLLAAVVPFVWLEVRLENMRKVKNVIRL